MMEVADTKMIDGALVERAIAGDRTALGELARRVYPRVVAFCRSRVFQTADAEELAQETMLRGLGNLSSLRDPIRIGVWLRGIAANVCFDWHRQRRLEVQLPEEIMASREHGPGEATALQDERYLVQQSIRQLHPKLQEVVYLFYFDELTYDEIAAWLGVARATVNTRLSQARDLLRVRLSSHGSAPL
ncbi:MAG: RNA polymerase sigma factor [Planctomycetaceae bacterium]|nr:RNA polymerase sigma factor [Planctomycetaceae bacterium]